MGPPHRTNLCQIVSLFPRRSSCFSLTKGFPTVSTNSNRPANKSGGPDLSQCFVAAPSLATLPPISDSHPKASPGAAQYPNVPVLPETFHDAAPNLLPMIQSRAMVEARSMSISAETPANPGFISMPYAEHLAICIVYDTPNMKLYLTASDVERWGVPVLEISQAAFGNLTQLRNGFRALSNDGRVFRSLEDDTYDATRLLFAPSCFEQLPVRGTHVAMVPHPNVLLVTGDQDAEGLHIVLTEARDVLKDGLAIGPFMFRLSKSGWEPWNPVLSSADRKEFDGLMIDMRDRDYARQQVLWRAHPEKIAPFDELFIATYKHLPRDRPDGLRTVSVWGKHVPSLLPKTDAIAFMIGKKFQGVVPWSIVAAQMEHELEPVGVHPERYTAFSFPTDEQLHDLIQEAVRRGVSQEP